MKKFSQLIFKLFGWEIDENAPKGLKKCVICMGPHTSNFDFILGKLAFMQYGVKGSFLIKKELFFFPLGLILKAMGGIPVDRKSNNNFTEQAVEYFKNNDTMYMVFTPEGTRGYNPKWKKGFYYIAQNANVPIYLAYVDYSKKKGGFLELFEPTGDVEADMKLIKSKLSKFKGRFPEKGILDPELE